MCSGAERQPIPTSIAVGGKRTATSTALAQGAIITIARHTRTVIVAKSGDVGPLDDVTCLAVHDSGRWLALARANKTLEVHDLDALFKAAESGMGGWGGEGGMGGDAEVAPPAYSAPLPKRASSLTFATNERGENGDVAPWLIVADKWGDVLGVCLSEGRTRCAMADPSTWSQPVVVMGHCCSIVTSLAVLPDCSAVASADRDGRVRVTAWPKALTPEMCAGAGGASEILSHCLGHEGAVTVVRCCQNEGQPALITGGLDGTVRIWDYRTGKQVCMWKGDDVAGVGDEPAAPRAVVDLGLSGDGHSATTQNLTHPGNRVYVLLEGSSEPVALNIVPPPACGSDDWNFPTAAEAARAAALEAMGMAPPPVAPKPDAPVDENAPKTTIEVAEIGKHQSSLTALPVAPCAMAVTADGCVMGATCEWPAAAYEKGWDGKADPKCTVSLIMRSKTNDNMHSIGALIKKLATVPVEIADGAYVGIQLPSDLRKKAYDAVDNEAKKDTRNDRKAKRQKTAKAGDDFVALDA